MRARIIVLCAAALLSLVTISVLVAVFVTQRKASLTKEQSGTTEQVTTDRCYCSDDALIELTEIDQTVTIASPGYPESYCTDQECGWTIVAPASLNAAIKLEWTAFSTEEGMDTVRISKRDDSDDIVCTGSSCLDQTSVSNEMHIKFVSDHVTTDLGFEAHVTALENDPCECSESLEIQLSTPDQSVSLKSPNYPQPYCTDKHRVCGWKIEAPEGYGLQIHWLEFEIEQGIDYVEIDDGVVEKNRCTGSICADVVSAGHEFVVTFDSDISETKHTGFHAMVSIVKNYCDKLATVSRASVSYSSEDVNGHIPDGGVAALQCDQGMKIAGSDENTTDSAMCDAPNWDKPLKNCIPACSLDITPRILSSNVQICELGSQPAPSMVTDGESIAVKFIDLSNRPDKSRTETYTCQYQTWLPDSPPICNRVGILVIGGRDDKNDEDQTIELYSTYSRSSQLLQIDAGKLAYLQLDRPATGLLYDGRVLVTGGSSPDYQKNNVALTHLIDLEKMEVIEAPDREGSSTKPGAATLNGDLYVCAGEPITNECQVFLFHQDQWKHFKNLTGVTKNGFQMVADDNFLYGIDADSMQLYSQSTDQWTRIGSGIGLYDFAAATLDGFVFVCGGKTTDDEIGHATAACRRYDLQNRAWVNVAPMLEARHSFQLVAFDNKLYALGGYGGKTEHHWQVVSSVEVYEPGLDKWEQAGNIQHKRTLFSAIVVPTALI